MPSGSLTGMGLRDKVAKDKLHPTGGRLSGKVGRGGKEDKLELRSHQAAPLGSLRDPDSFGAPPKHQGWYGQSKGALPPPVPKGKPGSTLGQDDEETGERKLTPVQQQMAHNKANMTDEQRLATQNMIRREAGDPRVGNARSLPPRPGSQTRGVPQPPTRQGSQLQITQYGEDPNSYGQEEEPEDEGPRYYSKDTTGLNTSGFAPPPQHSGKRAAGDPKPGEQPKKSIYAQSSTTPRNRAPPAPARSSPVTSPPPPARANTGASAASRPLPPPRPSLPPRQNSHPDEHTPEPPPAYHQPASPAPPRRANTVISPGPEDGYLNQTATSNLGRAGVQVPALGIDGGQASPSLQQQQQPAARGPPAGQMSELQARFARMNPNSGGDSGNPPASPGSGISLQNPAAAAAAKKAPPPKPPAKKAGLQGASVGQQQQQFGGGQDGGAPPPVPTGTKPRG